MTARTVRRLQVDHVVRSMIDPLVVTHADATIEDVNQATLDLLGYEAEELLGQPLSRVFPRPEGEANRLTSVIRRGGVIRSDRVAVTRDGRRIPVAFSASLLRDEGGAPVGLVAVARDISALKATEAELREAKERAEAASRLKSEFLANMSHELRTPLNSILGFARLLLKPGVGLGERDRSFAERIHDNGQRLLALINEVLDLSRIEAGRLEVATEAVDLGRLVAQSVGRFEPQARAKGLELVAECPDELDALIADRLRLGQVIDNLVANAIKFTDGGEVRVIVEAGPGGRTPTRLAVRDTGEGIPAHLLDAVFESFRQLDGRTARRQTGSGLGLAIARRLCELMGFEIGVTSEVGAGSVFELRFPAGRAPRAEPSSLPEVAAPCSSGSRLEGRRVLVVDDDPDARALVAAHLEELGCRVETAVSAEQALAAARAHPPDAITVDLVMSGMSGWQFLFALAEDPGLARVPVVVVSIIASDSRASLPERVVLLDKPVARAGLESALGTFFQAPTPEGGEP